jgi:hypothetical protein
MKTRRFFGGTRNIMAWLSQVNPRKSRRLEGTVAHFFSLSKNPSERSTLTTVTVSRWQPSRVELHMRISSKYTTKRIECTDRKYVITGLKIRVQMRGALFSPNGKHLNRKSWHLKVPGASGVPEGRCGTSGGAKSENSDLFEFITLSAAGRVVGSNPGSTFNPEGSACVPRVLPF